MDRIFKAAPWPAEKKLLGVVLLVSMPVLAYLAASHAPPEAFPRLASYALLALVPFLMFAGIASIVTGYEIDRTRVLVRRLLWPATEVPLAGLRRASHDPRSERALRNFGRKSFVYRGLVNNSRIGQVRLFGVNSENAVALEFADHAVVLSPVRPELVLRHLKELLPQVEIGEGPRRPS